MNFLKLFFKNLLVVIQAIILIILMFATGAFVFGGSVVILFALGNPSSIINFGLLKSLSFFIIYISSWAFILTLREI